jgi:hypothetical protein
MVTRKQSVPMTMAIGLSDGFLQRQEPAIARAGAVLLTSSVADAADMVTWWSPGVLILTEDVYSFDQGRFDALARAVGATLALLPDEDVSSSVVEKRVADAVADGRRMWAHPSSTKPPNISMVRPAFRREPLDRAIVSRDVGGANDAVDTQPPTVRQPALQRSKRTG